MEAKEKYFAGQGALDISLACRCLSVISKKLNGKSTFKKCGLCIKMLMFALRQLLGPHKALASASYQPLVS